MCYNNIGFENSIKQKEEVILLVQKQTFKGGFHVHGYKELTNNGKLKNIPAPKVVKIPLAQHIGAPATPVVAKGDYVKVGQLIGEASGFISANIHSSVSGTVQKIEEYPTQRGRNVMTVFIENDDKEELGYDVLDRDWTNMQGEDIVHIIKEAGITGLGGASFPTHVKVNPPKDKKIDSVIINAAECEPYLTADDTLLRNHAAEVVEGLLIIMKAVDAKNGYVTIEDNKPEAIGILTPICQEKGVKLVVAKTKYPQGDEKRIIDVTLGRVVPAGGLPADVGVVVDNTSTAYAIYEAVRFGKPLYERIVTFTGHGMKNPTNAMVRFGTTYGEGIDYLGGLTEDASQVIVGGPMMGNSLYSTDFPFEKANNGCLVITREESQIREATPCIKCKKCVDVCPVRLIPFQLEKAVKFGKKEMMLENHLMDCIECGSCSYICPATRPLVESIRIGKNQLRIKGSNK